MRGCRKEAGGGVVNWGPFCFAAKWQLGFFNVCNNQLSLLIDQGEASIRRYSESLQAWVEGLREADGDAGNS